MRMPVLMPVSTTSGSCLRYSRQAWITRPVSGGTTEASAMPVRSAGSCPTFASSPWNCRPYSSGMRSWSVARRQWLASLSPSYRPMVRLVLPTSIVSSIPLFYFLYDLCDQIKPIELRHDVDSLRPRFEALDEFNGQFHPHAGCPLPGVFHPPERFIGN